MNKLLGEKVSIISPKPQTTRQQVKGILTDENKQIIFLDTPGFVEARYELHTKMLEYLKNALKDSDVIVFITDAHKFPTNYDKKMCSLLNSLKKPKIALLNKIDLVEQNIVTGKLKELNEMDFEKVIPISILNNSNFSGLLEMITDFLPFNPPFYDPQEISDLPMRFFAQELIREQIFLRFRDEIPYASSVIVESFKELPNKIEISANIWIERKSQKPIILGKGGEKIKALKKASEKEMYKLLGKRIKLELWVKIKANWRKKKNALREFGYL